MAVVQISRVQVRRGRANSGTGLPQLASGELAWAIDTQELYIGNGAVSEGSPAVGNTKILTETDLLVQGNILNLVQHLYKATDPTITTGPDSNSPVYRPLRDVLDDRVYVKSFGALGDGITDDTLALQRAIDQLFLNPTIKSSSDTADGAATRVHLILAPGIYLTTSTLYIPSYASLIGAGSDKTVIACTGTGPVLQFINDSSSIGSVDSIDNTVANTQPRYILVKGISAKTSASDQPGLVLDAVRDSQFDDLVIEGGWSGTFNSASRGIAMYAKSSLVTCENNKFTNISITGFNCAVYAKQDTKNNVFNSGYISNVREGFVLGASANGSSVGEQFGPRETHISEYKFDNVKRQAVYLERGTGNTVSFLTMDNVGNDGGSIANAIYPQVYFGPADNSITAIQSDRPARLATSNLIQQYVPEVSGSVSYSLHSTREIVIGQISSPTLAFRLPLGTDAFGIAVDSISYNIDYVYKSISNQFTRKGVLTVVADTDYKVAQLSDEYNIAGANASDITKLAFSIVLLDEIGIPYIGTTGQIPASIGIYYINTLTSDSGYLSYTYSVVI
jgi:hypothetical protein